MVPVPPAFPELIIVVGIGICIDFVNCSIGSTYLVLLDFKPRARELKEICLI